MNVAVKFNKIYFLHSLKDNGYNLTRHIISHELPELQEKVPHISFKEFETNSLEEMNAALDFIAYEVKSGDSLPLLQFDMHGWEGHFLTKSHDVISFEDIAEKLSDINRLSKFNLLLFIASCEGGSFISEINPTKPSPCWGVVSSTQKFKECDASNFIEVYKKAIFEERDWRFVDVLNDGVSPGTVFSVFSAENIFKTVFRMYIENYMGEENIFQRAASIQSARGRGYIDIGELSRMQKTLSDIETPFYQYKKTFFMYDDMPENAKRFPLIVHDIYDVPIIGAPDPNNQE
ncbi:hypothetical protein [Solidesulfovibrio sp.]